MKLKQLSKEELKDFISSTKDMAYYSEALYRMKCPTEIIDELLYLRHGSDNKLNNFSDNSIMYLYPDLINPTEDVIKKVQQGFYNELNSLRTLKYE